MFSEKKTVEFAWRDGVNDFTIWPFSHTWRIELFANPDNCEDDRGIPFTFDMSAA